MNFILAGGPSFGLLKPYYILYDEINNNYDNAVSIPYVPEKHNPIFIYGAGGPFDGFDKLKVMLGAHIKDSLSFEFGIFNTSVAGLEFGLAADAYGRRAPIMYAAPNQRTFGSAFFTLYYGDKY